MTPLHQMVAREQLFIRRAFNAFLRKVHSRAVMTRILSMVRAKNIPGALAVIDDYLQTFGDQLSASFVRVNRTELQRARRSVIRKADVSRKTVRTMQRAKLEFIKEFTDQQRDTVREALTASVRRGEGTEQAARTFRSAIGLTTNQWKAVDSYRDALQRNSAEALDRTLRDKRFDRTVESALERGDVLAEDQIDRMVDRYADRMLSFRAATISRTEGNRVFSQARYAAWEEIADNVGIPLSGVVKTWNATKDARTRDTHAEMDGQQKPMDEPFISPSGAELMYPHDPSAPPEETINCRCVETYEMGE